MTSNSENDSTNISTKSPENDYCLSCNKLFEEADDGLECDVCHRWKHENCFTHDNFREESSKMFWACSRRCKIGLNNKAKFSEVNIEDVSSLKQISQMMKIFVDEIRQLKECFNPNVVKEMNLKIAQTEQEIIQIKDENNALKQRLSNLEQEKLNKKAVVINLPLKVNTQEEIFKSIQSCLSEELVELKCIKKCYGIKDKDGLFKAFLEFGGQEDKNKFMKAFKTLKMTDDSNQIRIYEMNTTEVRQLLTETRELLGKSYKFIWSKNGRVYVSGNHLDPKNAKRSTLVRNIEEAKKLCTKLDQNSLPKAKLVSEITTMIQDTSHSDGEMDCQ